VVKLEKAALATKPASTMNRAESRKDPLVRKRESRSPPILGFNIATRLCLLAAAAVVCLRGERPPLLLGEFFLNNRGALKFVGEYRLH